MADGQYTFAGELLNGALHYRLQTMLITITLLLGDSLDNLAHFRGYEAGFAFDGA